MTETVHPDGTVTDQLGNFVGIDQPAASRLLVAGVPTGAAPRGGHSVPLWSGEPSTPATNSLLS